MVPIPWRYVNSWRCSGCGICCREFEVVLKFDEWLNLIRTYGVSVTKAGLNKFFMRKKNDGSCLFLYMANGRWLCGLQNMKPAACKIWPFKISDTPRYGRAREALFNYKGQQLFVYIDPLCPEITWGNPSVEMIYQIMPEFIEIAIGLRQKQVYSTSTIFNNDFTQTKRRYRLI
ncbi:MAG: YkgJ family cysteine cluster protein [Candidatus Bathyarchaeia archaeon]